MIDDQPAGVIITSTTPPDYVPPAPEPEHYVSLLVTARARPPGARGALPYR